MILVSKSCSNSHLNIVIHHIQNCFSVSFDNEIFFDKDNDELPTHVLSANIELQKS